MSDLRKIIEVMLRPETYPHRVKDSVHMVQTQMSVVFLSGAYAYKVKKAVNLGYLDYTTLDKRKFFCLRELELNRRLCPDAYLDVLPLTIESGSLKLGGDGEVAEYTVKMRQLPMERMMDKLLVEGRVSADMVRAVAAKVAAFHQKAATDRHIDSFGEPCTVVVNNDENFTQTEEYIGRTITAEQYRKIKEYTETFIRDHAQLMHDRIDQGRIRDCHGDLHAAHVCFDNGICIYDCIEFNDRFRYADVASEVAFLAMDLDRYERRDLSNEFVSAYIAASQDTTLADILPFYKCYRAYVRGKVEGFKLNDPYLSEAEKKKALNSACRYFVLAESYVAKKLFLIIMVGMVGTGKTTVAEQIASRLGATVISSDVTRKKLAGIPPTDHRYGEPDSGIYSSDFSRRTYDTLFQEAKRIITEGKPVILDATFMLSAGRRQARELAAELGIKFMAIECVLPEEEARRRLDKRMQEVTASDAGWDIYLKHKKTFEPVRELPSEEHIVVDTSGSWQKELDKIMERLDP
ncbi:MAG: AAA family ATPase [Chloroflexi bacterium]|nr:AAA family ATPase [Chloroflexota bacterium]